MNGLEEMCVCVCVCVGGGGGGNKENVRSFVVKSDGIDVAKRDARKATHNLLIAIRILWGTIIGGKHNLPVKKASIYQWRHIQCGVLWPLRSEP